MATGDNDAKVFLTILVFLAAWTGIVGIINMASSGQISLDTLGSMTGTIPGQMTISGIGTPGGYIEGANTANGTIITNLDFTTAVSINPNVTTEIGGPWTLTPGTGLVLTGLPFLSGIINPSAIIVRNGQSTGTIYTTNVKVVNTGTDDFYVFPRFITGYSGSDLKVVFSYDGIHVKKFPLDYGFFDAGDDYFFPLEDSEITIAGGSTITTQLTETVSSQISNTPDYSSTLTVSKDGIPLFTTSARSILPGANINDQVRHGGAGSDTIGFVVMGFPNTPVLDTSLSIISGSSENIITQILAAIAQFGQIIGAAIGLSQNPAVPVGIWAVLGIPCIATLIYLGLKLIRG